MRWGSFTSRGRSFSADPFVEALSWTRAYHVGAAIVIRVPGDESAGDQAREGRTAGLERDDVALAFDS